LLILGSREKFARKVVRILEVRCNMDY
jgi:ribosomal protein L20A (L18A)